MMEPPPLLQAALDYAAAGWMVFPVLPRGKTPLTAHGFKDATTDPATIKGWWAKTPNANIGLDCGKSGFVVVDLDKHGDQDGVKMWDQLTAYHHITPQTCTSITGGGGRHVFFRAPEGVEIRNKASQLGPGIDVRASGGYVILPPSVHATGNAYEWDGDVTVVAPLPAPLVELLTAKPKTITPSPSTGYIPSDRYAAAALKDELSKLRQAQNGQRNDQLNRSAYSLGQLIGAGTLERGLVERELADMARSIGLGEAETTKTIRSGLDKGIGQPRIIPQSTYQTKKNGHGRANKTDAVDHDDSEGTAAEGKPNAPTDDELRDRFIGQRPEVVYGLGEFRAYDGAIYQPLERELVHGDVTSVLEAAKPEGIRPSAAKVASVAELLRTKVFVPSRLWNANTDLLPCANGVLHIPSRTLGPHAAEHYFTSLLPYNYDPTADAPQWNWFVTSTLPEAANFLQEFAGYALTTDMRHEAAVWFYGPPGSGKSTFIHGLQTMLGARAGLLSLADVERNRFALANLPGKTLVVSTEQPGDYISSGALLNTLISGEPLVVDRKFKDAVEVVSQAKLAWAMNSLPRVGDNNSGLFRRVKVVKFAPLPAERRDPELKGMIAAEGAGILNWALAGLDRLTARGRFDVPPCVVNATEDFRTTNDIPAQFVAEQCYTGEDYKAKAGTLYTAYKTWCLETGHKPQSMTSLANDWDRLGYEKYQAAGAYYRRGIGLRDLV